VGPDLLIAILVGVFSALAALSAVAYPLAFPGASILAHRLVFFGGLTLAALLAVAAVWIGVHARSEAVLPPAVNAPVTNSPTNSTAHAGMPAPEQARRVHKQPHPPRQPATSPRVCTSGANCPTNQTGGVSIGTLNE
jgi:hypothetical protein